MFVDGVMNVFSLLIEPPLYEFHHDVYWPIFLADVIFIRTFLLMLLEFILFESMYCI